MTLFPLATMGLFAGIVLAGAFLYRVGGASWGNTRYRDIGVSLCLCLTMGLLGAKNSLWAWLSLIPTFGLQWGCLSTYRYFLPKPKDYTTYYYALHGFMVAFAAFPFVWVTGHWAGWVIRNLTCAVIVALWSAWQTNDTKEEMGRGAILTASTLLLL
jgi:hypothetical protein